MSIYFNQTNIAPETPFATGGVLPQNPIFASVEFTPAEPTYGAFSDTLGSGFDPYVGSNMVSVVQKATLNLAQFQVGNYVEVQEGGNGPSSALWRSKYFSDRIQFIGANGNPIVTWSQNDLATGNVMLTSLSTLTAPSLTQKINLTALTSTLATAFPGCIT